jgi:cytochrome c oxidase assembly protein subunit 15
MNKWYKNFIKKLRKKITITIIFSFFLIRSIPGSLHLPLQAIMGDATLKRSSRPVAIWLLVGIAMIIIQVLLGGITRLTGSGLSITEWKPVMGALPPMNEQQWNEAFEKYKQIAQYKYLNSSFTLHDFKFIFFWEWIHRLWARLIGVAFIIPFVIFLIQKRFKKDMIKPMIILFLLGALQGLVGWIMVMSGLEDADRLYVSHYKLAIHFILALGVLCYTLWFALELLVPREKIIFNSSLKKFTGWLIAILVLQLIYGAFIAGLKAASFAPTWPDINGSFFPHGGTPSSGILQFFDNPITVQFIHRFLAYVITVLIFTWFLRSEKTGDSPLIRKTNEVPFLLVVVQVILGILTVLNSLNSKALLWLGVAHQFVAMILLLSLVFQFYLLSGKKRVMTLS